MYVFFMGENVTDQYQFWFEVHDGDDPEFVAANVKNDVIFNQINTAKKFFEFGKICGFYM